MTYFTYFKMECLVLFRRKQNLLNALLFFVLVIVLFPLGVSPSADFLSPAAGGIIWCAAALATIVSLEGMFKEDFADGSLEQLLVSGLSMPWLVLLKIVAHWLAVIGPLLMLTPLFSHMLFLPAGSLSVLMMTLLLGTPTLFLIGSIGAALTVSLRQGALLMLLVILPFYLPVIIFSTSAIQSVQFDLPYSGLLAILAAMSLLALVVSPLMASICIKASVH